ncbi:unnamed protein product [Ostreobium quekettii]|uniref:Uncharacterized protein n=1 Tax=Ostreobium quekettii TaxID=121088 RepID=A0A8S1IX64_9CHLO|nr:unnamed protein product [Ostreobium quekettii]
MLCCWPHDARSSTEFLNLLKPQRTRKKYYSFGGSGGHFGFGQPHMLRILLPVVFGSGFGGGHDLLRMYWGFLAHRVSRPGKNQLPLPLGGHVQPVCICAVGATGHVAGLQGWDLSRSPKEATRHLEVGVRGH